LALAGQLDQELVHNDTALHLVPVHSNDGGKTYDYWKIPLKFIIVNSHLVTLSTSRVSSSPSLAPLAVFDTGTTLLLGPTRDVAAIYAQVPSAELEGGQWKMDCTEVVWVGVGFASGVSTGMSGSSQVYWVHPLDMSWDEGDGGKRKGRCLGGVQANDDVTSGDWLFGDTFLRNIYLAHYGHNSTMSPTLGLLGLTDPISALVDFAHHRDVNASNFSASLPTFNVPNDSSLPQFYHHQEHSVVWTHGLILGLACLGGFLSGLVGAILFQAPRIQVSKRLQRR